MSKGRLRSWALVLTWIICLPRPACAELIAVLDFDGPSGNYIAEYYNGLQDGGGHTGPDFGISFVRSTAYNFSHIQSQSGSGFLAISDTGAFMNIQDGFDSLTFNYAAGSYYEGRIRFWDGMNGNGSLLGELWLESTVSSIIHSCPVSCATESLTYVIPGTAKSAALPYMYGAAVIDDLRIYRSSNVREPATACLLIGIFLLLGATGGPRPNYRTVRCVP
jgi:hypothetical protein